jgi:hypothetical protein
MFIIAMGIAVTAGALVGMIIVASIYERKIDAAYRSCKTTEELFALMDRIEPNRLNG